MSPAAVLSLSTLLAALIGGLQALALNTATIALYRCQIPSPGPSSLTRPLATSAGSCSYGALTRSRLP